MSLYQRYKESKKKSNVLSSYDPMEITYQENNNGFGEATYELTQSHQQRVDSLYSKIKNIRNRALGY